jgi:hypothetical protein
MTINATLEKSLSQGIQTEQSEKLVKLVKSPVDRNSDPIYSSDNTGNGIIIKNGLRRQTMAKSQEVLENIKTICRTTWGDESMYEGPSGKYKWELGRDTGNGIINGVVRKMVAEDKDGNEIYVVAGSFKIDPSGEVSRWTGLPRRFQKEASQMANLTGTNGSKS